jgi:hypothetical protein
MKLKMDFITNSSSASFILYVESVVKDISEFEQLWNKYVDYFIESHSYKLLKNAEEYKENAKDSIERKKKIEEKIKNNEAIQIHEKMWFDSYSHLIERNVENTSDYDWMRYTLGEMNVKQVVGPLFTISNHITMLNELEDIPNWMLHLILLDKTKDNKLLNFGITNVSILVVERDY